jgi:hypothetical protein
MSLYKVAQNVAQPMSRQNQYIIFTVEKSGQNICATSVIYKKNCQSTQPTKRQKLVHSGHPG